MRYEVTEYQHDGHPEIAAQYSQGTFRTGRYITNTQTRAVDRIERELRDESDTWVGRDIGDAGISCFIQEDDVAIETDEFESTLRVTATCNAEDHGAEDCECWEYVHTFGLVEVADAEAAV